jgi:HK97 gp10 family phage protein
MADTMVTVEVTGLKELSDNLRALDIEMQRTIMKRAVQAGATVILEEAERLVPKKSGKLAESIKLSIRSDVDVSEIEGTIGVNSPLAHLVEFGTQGTHGNNIVAGKRGRRGKSTGKKAIAADGTIYGTTAVIPPMKARPYMRPAFDTKKDAAVDTMAGVIAEGIAAATSNTST